MKVLSVLAISTACSISLSFLAKIQPACAKNDTKNGQLSPGKVDSYTFSGLKPGELFDAKVNANQNVLDPLLGLRNNSGNILEINQDRSDFSILPEITGVVPANGSLNFAVSGSVDTTLAGEHHEYGPYGLSLKTFDIPKVPIKNKLINGGFETGNLTGWTTLGENSIETSAFGITPTQESFQALLSTGGSSFADSIIEQFLGLNSGSLAQLVALPPEGFELPTDAQRPHASAIQQTFEAKAGDILSFDYNFLTNELPYRVSFSFPDFSFVSISSKENSISSLLKLADASQFPVDSPSLSKIQFFQDSGFHTFSYKIPNDGRYTLGVGVSDAFDRFADSGLLVDNFTIEHVFDPNQASTLAVQLRTTSVPEPTSMLSVLGFGAFLGASSLLKRKQRQKAAVVNSSR